jgi:hypothetical protein
MTVKRLSMQIYDTYRVQNLGSVPVAILRQANALRNVFEVVAL